MGAEDGENGPVHPWSPVLPTSTPGPEMAHRGARRISGWRGEECCPCPLAPGSPGVSPAGSPPQQEALRRLHRVCISALIEPRPPG